MSVFTLLAGCASSGYNLEEAISKWIAYPISDIVHIEELQEGAVVFYLSPKDDHDLPAVAFFRKTEKGGWIGVGPLDLLDFRGGKLFFDWITADLNSGETHDERVQVIYGQINDPNITELKVRSTDNKFVNVEIIEIPDGRFYFYRWKI